MTTWQDDGQGGGGKRCSRSEEGSMMVGAGDVQGAGGGGESVLGSGG